MFTFAASRTSGEVQHNFGDASLHSRFGSQHFGRFPAICGLKNVMLPETAEGLKIWRGANDGEGFTSNSNKIKEREGKWPLSFRRTCRMAMCFRGQELRCRGLGSNVKSYLPKGSFKRLTLH